MVVVAQLVRVSVCGTEGRGFESRLPPKKSSLLEKAFFIINEKKLLDYFREVFLFFNHSSYLSLCLKRL